ncbi:MAG: GNAT family N-acetyltransferase [Polyangiaceae bacterium]
MTEFRRLEKHDVREAASVLGRAFADNPGYLSILPFLSAEERRRTVERVKRGFVEAAVRHQFAEAIVRDGRIAAAMLGSDPGQYPPTLTAKAWQASGCATAGPRGIRNFLVYDAFSSRVHLREPHFYLFVLGVDPEQQGRGLGKSLLHRLNARADEKRLPCFLETDRETSVVLYRSVGYEVTTNQTCTKLDGLRMWSMIRKPR